MLHSGPRRPNGRRLAARAVSLALGLSALACSPVADRKAGPYYEDALARYEKLDFKGAELQLKNAMQIDAGMPQVHLLLGKVQLGSGSIPAAEVALSMALQLGASRDDVVVPLALSVAAQGKPQLIVEQPRFELAGLSAPVKAQMLVIKSFAYGDLGDRPAALKALEDARAADPKSADAWLAEVPLRLHSGQIQEALVAVNKARAIDPNAAEVYYQYGTILHLMGNRTQTLPAYDKALAITPGHVNARVARAGLLIDMKRDEDAAKDVAELVAKTPLEPRGWYFSALLAERAGKPQARSDALHEVTNLLDRLPIEFLRYRPHLALLNSQAHYGLGDLVKARLLLEFFQRVQPGGATSKVLADFYLAERNPDGAIDALVPYLRAFPRDSQAKVLLASAYMAKGRHAQASGLMQDALRGKDNAELYATYGLSLLGSGQPANALTQLETAYKKDPGLTQAAFALVGLYLRDNDLNKALAVANELVNRNPTNPSVVHLLGTVKERKGDTAGARAAFEQAIKLDAGMVPASLSLARLEAGANNFARAQVLLDGMLKANARNTEAMFEQAALAERRGNPQDSLRWLQKTFEMAGSKDVRSALALADLHMRQGRPAEALKISQRLAGDRPEDVRVLMALAPAQLASGEVAAARKTLEAAARFAGYNPSALVEIARLQLAADNLPGANYSLEKALSGKPDDLRAQVLMADVEAREGEFAKAERRAQQIIRQEPKLAIGYSLSGDLAWARKQPGPAIDAYRRAFQVQPSTDTFSRLFTVLAGQDPKAAIGLAGAWLKAHPGDIAARKLLAQAQARANNLVLARQEYERLHQLVPKDAAVLNNLANVLLRLKDPQALPVAEQALELAPDNAAVKDTVGWAAYQAGQVDRAVNLLRDARQRNPADGEIRYHFAMALAKTGKTVEAREELEAALNLKTGFNGRGDAEALLRSLK